ncbi:CUB and sushi domain-containing protein 1-like [Uloborus diversus]|uniref:CUB and sushi domain-containing protein 1-like n=1 Tax=Uloborus diversus TaxID=327109 RepID=UPI00240A96E9|nr:CUB and sushi domain-containing protein 1-like [Uloborus diversus]
MIPVVKSCMLLAVALASSGMFSTAFQITPEDCGDIQHDVENGLIRLPDFSGESIRDLNCSWTYTAPVGRKLLVKVDSVHLPPLELRTSQFQLYIDDTFYDIPRNCVKCLREMVGGKVLNVIFTSTVAPFSDYHALNASEVASLNEGIGSFQVRYKAFDPHRCGKPEQIENGYLTSKGRKVGQSIFYHCYPPYDLIGDSELQCVVTSETPVPDWSNNAPKCVVQDCTGEPITKRGMSGAIASPGYPSYVSQFIVPCIWEIVAQPNQQIKVSITYLKFPKRVDNSFSDNTSRLSLLDGDYNYIVNLTESLINGPLNYTTLTNKLTVEFIVNDDPKKKEEIGVYIDYSTISSSCPKPKSPENGEVIAYSNDLGSTVAYRCNQGFVLVGELHAECLFNGQWSHPTPTCEPININLPSFLYASNDSDTVTAKLADIPLQPEIPKISKNGKKKNGEVMSEENELNFTEVKEKLSVPKENQLSPSPTESGKGSDIKSGKSLEKENGHGPKSEPHLLQVIPPKENVEKSVEKEISNPAVVPKSLNVNKTRELLPALDTGYTQEIDIAGFKISLLMIYIIAGVGIPLIIIVIVVVVIVIYRKKYPVRMRFGRKFSTFENPMYVSKDAHHPRELKRLTK